VFIMMIFSWNRTGADPMGTGAGTPE